MKKPCNHPGCAALIDRGTYCPTHQSSAPKRHTIYNKYVRANDPALSLAHKIRKSARWGKVRRLVLADNPICADPFGDHARAGVTRTSTQVHHIRGLAEAPELAFYADNLQALCTGCHARIEREHRAGVTREPQPSSRKADGTHPPRGESQKFSPFG